MKKVVSGINFVDSFIRLRDANGNQLGKDRMNRDAFNDDIDRSLSNFDSRLIYEIASSGTYYIDAGSHTPRGSVGDYTLAYKVI